MAAIVSALDIPSHRVITETREKAVRVDLRKPDEDVWRHKIGHMVARCQALSGMSLKEFAGAIGRDERQVSRWIKGDERVQIDAIVAVPALRQPFRQALAEETGGRVRVVIDDEIVGG